MTRDTNSTPIRELNDDELARVSGGTSGLIYAVAQAAHKVLAAQERSFGAGIANDLNGQPSCH